MYALTQQVDGRVIVGGNFTAIGTATRNRLARLMSLGQMTGVQTISAGYAHTCATQGDAAMCWGANYFGQLGNNGDISGSATAVPVQGLERSVAAVSAGEEHTCAIHDGAAKCWGWNLYGQLGNGSMANSTTPVQVQGLDMGVTAISAGLYHSCAIHNGAAKCWGRNHAGQLGNVSYLDRSSPVQVVGLESGVTAISAGGQHTCAIHKGAAKCWGSNAFGQLGNDSTMDSSVPTPVQGLANDATQISAGGHYTCAIQYGALAKCWGANDYGQLGNNSTTGSRVPIQVIGLGGDTPLIDATWYHSCAIQNGAAKCWGRNRRGQLGDGNADTTPVMFPAPVSGLGSGTTAISAGSEHTCAIHHGAATCWGLNNSGQVGNNHPSNDPVTIPVPVWVEMPPPGEAVIFRNGFE